MWKNHMGCMSGEQFECPKWEKNTFIFDDAISAMNIINSCFKACTQILWDVGMHSHSIEVRDGWPVQPPLSQRR